MTNISKGARTAEQILASYSNGTINPDPKVWLMDKDNDLKLALSTLQEDLLGLVGEDEFSDEATEYWQPARIKNELRAELRTKIIEYMGGR